MLRQNLAQRAGAFLERFHRTTHLLENGKVQIRGGHRATGPLDMLTVLEAQLAAAYGIQTPKLGTQIGWERQGKVLNRVVACDAVG